MTAYPPSPVAAVALDANFCVSAALTADNDPKRDVPADADTPALLPNAREEVAEAADEAPMAAAVDEEDLAAPEASPETLAPLDCRTLARRAAPPLSNPTGADSVSDFSCLQRSNSSARLSLPVCWAESSSTNS